MQKKKIKLLFLFEVWAPWHGENNRKELYKLIWHSFYQCKNLLESQKNNSELLFLKINSFILIGG